MKRREFLLRTAAISAWSTVPVLLSACGDDDDGGTGTNGTSAKTGSISSNHGHSVQISGAQQDAGQGVTLTLSGGSHSHSLTLDSSEVQAIASGTQVTKASSVDNGHPHDVTFN